MSILCGICLDASESCACVHEDCNCGKESCLICEWKWQDDADLDNFGA